MERMFRRRRTENSLGSHANGFASTTAKDCTLDISRLPAFHPWLLHPRTYKIVYPSAGSNIVLSHGDELLLFCSGQGNRFFAVEKTALALTKCKNGLIKYKGSTMNVHDYRCHSMPTTVMRRTRIPCYNRNNVKFAVGFWIKSHFRHFTTVYELCVDVRDPNLVSTKYAIHQIQSAVQYRQNMFDAEEKRVFQAHNKSRSPSFEAKRIEHNLSNRMTFYLGYFARKEDFVYMAEQLATYVRANVAPPRSQTNRGVYAAMESDIRDFAASRGPVTVYTGTIGVLEYGDQSSREENVKLSHDLSPYNPVPRLFWKVLLNKDSTRSIALVYKNQLDDRDFEEWCSDVTPKVAWLKGWQSGRNEGACAGTCCYACEATSFLRSDKHLLHEFPKKNMTLLE